jgi:hypothetical protein
MQYQVWYYTGELWYHRRYEMGVDMQTRSSRTVVRIAQLHRASALPRRILHDTTCTTMRVDPKSAPLSTSSHETHSYTMRADRRSPVRGSKQGPSYVIFQSRPSPTRTSFHNPTLRDCKLAFRCNSLVRIRSTSPRSLDSRAMMPSRFWFSILLCLPHQECEGRGGCWFYMVIGFPLDAG